MGKSNIKIQIDISKMDEVDKKIEDKIGPSEGLNKTEPAPFPDDDQAEEDAKILLDAYNIKKDKTRVNKALEIIGNKAQMINSIADLKNKYNDLVEEPEED